MYATETMTVAKKAKRKQKVKTPHKYVPADITKADPGPARPPPPPPF